MRKIIELATRRSRVRIQGKQNSNKASDRKTFFINIAHNIYTDQKLPKPFFDICNNKLSNQPCNWNVPGSNPRQVKLKLTPVP